MGKSKVNKTYITKNRFVFISRRLYLSSSLVTLHQRKPQIIQGGYVDA